MLRSPIVKRMSYLYRHSPSLILRVYIYRLFYELRHKILQLTNRFSCHKPIQENFPIFFALRVFQYRITTRKIQNKCKESAWMSNTIRNAYLIKHLTMRWKVAALENVKTVVGYFF